MNAREVMQALLDGQTVESVYGKFKLEPNGEILHFYVNDEEWDVADMIFNDIRAEFKIVEEYPLTFKEATQMMAQGHVTACEQYPDYRYWFDDEGCILCMHHDQKGTFVPSILSEGFCSKWKVVE